jgi:hypothetical protein
VNAVGLRGHGAHANDIPLEHIIDIALKVKAQLVIPGFIASRQRSRPLWWL